MGVTFSLLQRLPRSFFPWPIVARYVGYGFSVCRETSCETKAMIPRLAWNDRFFCLEKTFALPNETNLFELLKKGSIKVSCPLNALFRIHPNTRSNYFD